MKNKIIHFGVALGLPLASCLGNKGCTGICGQCNFSCTPGLFVVLFLMGKMLYQKYWIRIGAHAKKNI